MIARDTTIGLIQLQSDTKDRFGQEETNLLSLVANTAAVAIENTRLLSETQKRLRNLSALHAIDTAIGASVDIRVTLNILLEQTAAQLKVDAAAVLLLNPFTHALEYTASYGFRAHLVNGRRIQLGSGVAGQAALTRQMQSISDQRGTPISQEKQKSTFDVYEGEEFFTHYAFPLVAKGQVQGVIEVYHRSLFQPDEEWLTFFNMLAGQAAIAIDNAHLFEDLQRSNLDMVLAYDATIQGWSQALELRDKETQGHTQRVTDLTLRLAPMIGVPDAELEHVRRGTLLHDIGKMGIPDSILLKPGKLTKEEWVVMRQHPGYAYEMLSSIAYLRPALDIPHYHHEKWDGSGYPDGLKGEQIPLYARIFAVVDVYDALTSKRPYRPAWTVEKAIKHIRKQSGKHFDPEIVEAFLNLISEEN
jgi:HD-GYP domain-containing protein (c-di-GMP phosphodiesterase class II)